MELLMEKIRSKASQYKSFAESAKTLRMSQLEKRYPLDVADRNQLQKCLDTLQQSMKVTSLQGMVERLESISRHLSLKLMAGQTGLELFISSDMFYLEVSLEPTGHVKDVKVHHEGKTEQQSCEELVNCLSRGDFTDFTTQLEGLISIYQLNAEKKVKCKAFSALCALESDLTALWMSHSNIKDAQTLLVKSPVGILEKRRGGHPLCLTYFVSPYDVLEAKTTLTVENVVQHKLGCSVTICLEGSAAHKLQTSPLITLSKSSSGRSSPSYIAMSPSNSATLPAYFVLKLNKPMPLCTEIVNSIKQITELEIEDISTPHHMLSLLTLHISNGKLDSANNKGLFVNLPDQVHCYFMTECKGLDGVTVSNIPFTHPAQVPQILNLLRQQALFNALIESSIRPHSKQDVENMIMLEISSLSWQHISVTFEHPVGESMATVELDLTDLANIKANLYPAGTEYSPQTSPEHVSKILQRCLSIPVTMRSLIKNLQKQAENNFNSQNGNFLSSAPSGGVGGNNSHGHDFGGSLDTSKIKQEPGLNNETGGRGNMLGNQFNEFSSAFNTNVLDDNQSILNLGTDKQKRKHDKWKKRNSTEDEVVIENSSDSASVGTPSEDVEMEEPDTSAKDEVVDEIDDVEELLKVPVKEKPKKKEVKKSPSQLIMDLAESKSMIPPSVTITPITTSVSTNLNSVLSGMGLERRPGIEIIPIQSAPTTNLPSSITITPISTTKDDKKNKKSEDKLRLEKKRKRKREESESKMGPPEKVPSKADALTKPVSVSIKPTSDSPPNPRPNSPSVRKYDTSPTQFSKTISKHPLSPKPSFSSSPKHNSGASPKHGTNSPKSGKPSMSALKSAASSPKNEKKKESRDPTRKSFSSPNSSSGSPKIKSSTVKLKQLDLSMDGLQNSTGDGKNQGNPLQRNRKGSLSAVIDKLKSAQEVIDVAGPVRKEGNGGSSKDSRGGANVTVVLDGKQPLIKTPDGVKNPAEYMVKPSLDGMKITINKTRTKDSSKSSKSGSGSPKTHTGLKPGVISGPASKKTHVAVTKPLTNKPNSSLSKSSSIKSSLVSKSKSSSPKLDGNRKDMKRPIKNDKSVFSKDMTRKGSPGPKDEEHSFKISKMDNALPLVVEGLMKPFDTKFQIPKLSARNNTTDDKKDKLEIKVIDLASKNLDVASNLKYQASVPKSDDRSAKTSTSSVPNPLSLPMALTTVSPKLPLTSPNLPTTSLSSITSKLDRSDDDKTSQTSLTETKTETKTEKSDGKKVEESSKKTLLIPVSDSTKTKQAPATPQQQEAAELLLDFSSSNATKTSEKDKPLSLHRTTPPPNAQFLPPKSPINVQFTKSPVASPMLTQSPHSPQSITDDELMDEALMLRK